MTDNLTQSHPRSSKLTIEWAPFALKEEVSEATLLTASDALQTEFVSQQPGFIRRELLKGQDNQWVDVVYWNSLANAEAAASHAANNTAALDYFTLMVEVDQADPGAGVAHFEQVKTYS